MRARKRRNVFNTISAAMLEVSIMGLFVILAQPQLRDALFEFINPSDVVATTQPTGSTTTANNTHLERTIQAVMNSSVGQAFNKAVEEKLADSKLQQIASVVGLPLPSTSNTSAHAQMASAQLRPTTASTTPSWTVPSRSGEYVAHYAPLEQYESFRVDVPNTQQSVTGQYGYQQPTQLMPNQWNIASARQSTLPPLNYNGWAPVHAAQTSYHDIYAPPYGTQSQWR